MLRHKPFDKKAFRRSFWAAVGRLLGIMCTVGAGNILYKIIGSNTIAASMAIMLAIIGFLLSWLTEYEREIE